MYICLTRRQPLSTNLTTFELSRAFVDTNPESLANRAVYLCAKVLEWGVGPTTPGTVNSNSWIGLLEALHEWISLVPAEYGVLYADRRSTESDVPASNFPTVWVTHSAFSRSRRAFPRNVQTLSIHFSCRISARLSCSVADLYAPPMPS